MEVSKLLDDTGKHAREELNTPVDIEKVEEFPPPDEIYIEKRTWKKIENVVVVSADLKGSTKLNFNKYAHSRDKEITAREAATILGIKPDSVRGYIRSGRMLGRYDGEPTWRGWLTTRAAVENYRSKRGS